ncbi:MAG: hypothetical protein ABSE49_15400 [Polyangiaceae bacterium]|jgi:hypothetical protein
MNRITFRAIAGAVAAVCAAGCGGTPEMGGAVGSTSGEATTMNALLSGAGEQRAYVGVDNHVTLGESPVVATMGLLGGSQLELEVVTTDGSPMQFEVWRARSDGSATLEMPVDATSGFALEDVDPVEDGTWLVVFAGGQHADVIVHGDCVGGLHGCAEARQPGESCPPGWPCDVGLVCEGTCVFPSPATAPPIQ